MKTTLRIKGMHCGSCAILIKDICAEMEGITKFNLDEKKGILVLEHNDKKVIQEFKKELESLGSYKVMEQ